MIRQFILVFAYVVAMGMAIESFGADLPSFQLSRHFTAGGNETLSLQCHGDRTRAEGLVCEITRRRNGTEVAKVVVDYEWCRLQIDKFVARVPTKKPVSVEGQLLLSYEAQYEGRHLQGKIGSSDFEQAKAALALEGSLASQFYR